MSKILVRRGQHVNQGDVGRVGNRLFRTGPSCLLSFLEKRKTGGCTKIKFPGGENE
jgi:hypothetical protein